MSYRLWIAMTVMGLLFGCVSKEAARNPATPANDVAECRQLVRSSLVAVQSTLRTLEQVEALTQPCSPALFDQLARDVHRLTVDSFQVRAHARAMQARGKAYFEQWEANLSRTKDPLVRQRAEKSHLELEETFATVRAAAQPTREAFHPFLKTVRELRNELEKDPASSTKDSSRAMVRFALEKGHAVEHGLDSILEGLTQAAALLGPVQAVSR